MNEFVSSYIETALWSSIDDKDEPLDSNYGVSDFSSAAMTQIEADCQRFQDENAETLAAFSTTQTAHDFWLTRNGHGAGFWDGDYPEPQATILTDASKAFGECNLYIGDDGLIYATS